MDTYTLIYVLISSQGQKIHVQKVCILHFAKYYK